MRLLIVLLSVLLPSIAVAHPGHIADVAGHNHWVAGAAIGLAIAIGVWTAVKGAKAKKPESEDEDADQQEA